MSVKTNVTIRERPDILESPKRARPVELAARPFPMRDDEAFSVGRREVLPADGRLPSGHGHAADRIVQKSSARWGAVRYAYGSRK